MNPKPDSFWLVFVECRPCVVHVAISGKGFYIPGQEPCWDLSHVQEWICDVDELIYSVNGLEKLREDLYLKLMNFSTLNKSNESRQTGKQNSQG